MTRTSPTAAPQPTPAHGARAGRSRKLYGMMAEFDSVDDIMAGAHAAREAGYRWWDCHTPFPVHGLDKAMGVRPTILPVLVFGAGMTGTILAFILQWFTNATSFDFWAFLPVRGYDFLTSGKPGLSGSVYPIVMFEITVLFAAVGCVILMFVLNGLPQLYHPCFKSERFLRATDDRFFLIIESRDPKFYRHQTEEFLESLNPISIEALEA